MAILKGCSWLASDGALMSCTPRGASGCHSTGQRNGKLSSRV